MGHDAQIISYKYLYPSFLFPGKTQFSESENGKAIMIHPLIHSADPFNWSMVASIISRLKPDLVVIHYWMPFFAPSLGMIARKLKHKTGTRIIAITHNLIPHEKHPGWKILTRFFLKSIDGIVALSSSVLKDYEIMKVSGRATWIPHPLYNIYGEKLPRDKSAEALGLDPGRKYILFFGIIREYKGLRLLLKAFSLLKREDLTLIIAGEFYEDKKEYIKLAIEIGIYNRLIITDNYVPDGDVRKYFSVAEMVVQPYLSASQSGVTQIAYHFDCPMVVTDVGGLSEIVINGKTGYVCNRDPGEIADAIMKILDPLNYGRMVDEIRNEKKRFSWTGFVENITKLIPCFLIIKGISSGYLFFI